MISGFCPILSTDLRTKPKLIRNLQSFCKESKPTSYPSSVHSPQTNQLIKRSSIREEASLSHNLAVSNTHNNVFLCDSRMQIVNCHLGTFQRTERQLPTQTNASHKEGSRQDSRESITKKVTKGMSGKVGTHTQRGEVQLVVGSTNGHKSPAHLTAIKKPLLHTNFSLK